MEFFILESISEQLKHKQILDSQHGFRPKRNCLSNLLIFLEEATSYINKGYPVDVIYLDFSKAFDMVPHRRLISKLTAHGITGKTNRWIESWLTDRRRVCRSDAESDWQKVISGVPQGSILGPMLFVIFINDIDSTVVSSLLKCADDTKTLRQVPEVEYALTLQEDLHSMYNWSQDWQLLFNFTKCKCLHIGYNNPNYDYFMGDVRIVSIDMEKDHTSLKVKEQVNYVVKKANRILGIIRRTYTDKSMKNIKNLYITLVHHRKLPTGMVPTTSERYRQIRKCPEEGH